MRRPVEVVVCLLAATPLVTSSCTRTQTVTGRLVDLACYALDRANVTNVHRNRGYACAQACAREGFSVGLLTTDGKVYQVAGELAANKNAQLVPHLAQVVAITGVVGEKQGITIIAGRDLKVTGT